MKVSAVLFDLGNTLLEYSLQGRWEEFLRRRLEEMYPLIFDNVRPAGLSAADFAEKVGKIIGGRGRLVEQNGHSWHFGKRLGEGLAAVGVKLETAQLERLTEFFYQPVRAGASLYPETCEVLAQLRAADLKLVIITNSPWDVPLRLMRGDLAQWDLERFFDAFICSGNLAWRKPNPDFMFAAAEKVGVLPAGCLVVGDNLQADIAGAQAAGMKSVWINRTGATVPAGCPPPDWTERSLVEVMEIVK